MSEVKIDWAEIQIDAGDPQTGGQIIDRYLEAYNESANFWALSRTELQEVEQRISRARTSLPEVVQAAEELRLRGDSSTLTAFERLEEIKLAALKRYIPDAHRARTLEELTDPRRFGQYETDRFPHFARYLLVSGEQIPGPVFAAAYITGFEMHAATIVQDFATRARISEGPFAALPAFSRGLQDPSSPISTVYTQYKAATRTTS